MIRHAHVARSGGLLFFLLLMLAAALQVFPAAGTALAQTAVTGFRPGCGAEGDPILIEGTFPTSVPPTVTIAGTPARVLRASGSRILARVGLGTPPGSATLAVDGVAAPSPFEVLGPSSPVVYRLSAQTATVGQVVLAFGRRLGPGTTVDVGGVAATNVRVARGRVLAFTVPAGVAGPVLVTFTNAGGSTGACSPMLTVVAAGPPTVTGFDPASQRPGGRLVIIGADLGPLGLHGVTWDDGTNPPLDVRGASNGYDRVFTSVPARARPGAAYTVSVAVPGGAATATYTVAPLVAPVIDLLSPNAGPARTRFRIEGSSFFQRGARTQIALGGVGIPVLGFFRDPATGKDNLLTLVPDGTADGAYPVVVTVGGLDSNADKLFTVGTQPLTVTSLRPDTVGPRGPLPIEIRGSGFGNPGSGPIVVTFTPAGGPSRDGTILFRNDNLLIVLPPGGRRSPLPSGVYTVEVVVGTGSGRRSVVAGTYTVP